MPPKSISHYNVLGELGRGGMGVVYKASDTKLNRTVALKVLPQHALVSEDDRARFYREARSAAALHHPNIATVFEIDEDDGQPFIAIEFVDGKSLQDRIAEGPLPLKDAVSIASQMAEGLKVAHAANIVHRDIKSANVMLSKDGKAKILDFGLAKTAASTKLTQMGSTLGTVAYMSPEQARGEEVDHRTDLWSLGAVLYEMISGKLPFPGEFEQAIVYAILHQEPKPLTAVRTGVPMGLEWIVSKLLAKDREDRYQSAADLLVDLRTVDLTEAGMSRIHSSSTLIGEPVAAVKTKPARRTGSVSWPLLGLAFVAGLAIASGVWLLRSKHEPYVERSVKRFEVPLRTRGGISGLDISPGGSKIVYADVDNTVDNVHVLDLSTGATRTIEGSAGTVVVAVSPDGQWVLLTKYLSIDRVSLSGGAPLEVVRTTEGTPRASWGPADWIIYEDKSAIWKASTSGRDVEPLTVLDSTAGEVDHDWPRMLPDGKTLMVTVEYLDQPSTIGFYDFDTGKKLGQIAFAGYRPQYVATGDLLFVLGGLTGQLVVLPFDLKTHSATGSPIPIIANGTTAIASVSNGGTFVSGGAQGGELRVTRQSRLVTVTFPKTEKVLPFEPAVYRNFELSPNEKKLVAQIQSVASSGGRLIEQGDDVWVLDLVRGAKLQLTFDGKGRNPTWMPNGDSVAYIDDSELTTKVKVRSADGSGEARELFALNANILDVAISPDRRHAAYLLGNSDVGITKLFIRDLQSGQTVDFSGENNTTIRNPAFSPDGRYVAYKEGLRIVVRAVDATGVPIYVGQASDPHWSKDGSKVYSVGDEGNVYATDVSLTPTFSVGSWHPLALDMGGPYAIFGDGQSGIFTQANSLVLSDSADLDQPNAGGGGASAPKDTTVSVTVTVNWLETIK